MLLLIHGFFLYSTLYLFTGFFFNLMGANNSEQDCQQIYKTSRVQKSKSQRCFLIVLESKCIKKKTTTQRRSSTRLPRELNFVFFALLANDAGPCSNWAARAEVIPSATSNQYYHRKAPQLRVQPPPAAGGFAGGDGDTEESRV